MKQGGRPSRKSTIVRNIILALLAKYDGSVLKVAAVFDTNRQQIYEWRDRTPKNPRTSTLRKFLEVARLEGLLTESGGEEKNENTD